MTEPARTPWFPPEQKPAYPGRYERDYGPHAERLTPGVICDTWDGTQWVYRLFDGEPIAICQSLPWRGLAERPAPGPWRPPEDRPRAERGWFERQQPDGGSEVAEWVRGHWHAPGLLPWRPMP